jgi:peptide/nickel transport system ATP-binding protein
MNLIDSPPGFITAGRIFFDGEDLLSLTAQQRQQLNGRRIAMIFQDPLASLNPVYPVGWQVAETFRNHGIAAAEAGQRGIALLERVGIPDPARRARDYPHQFSGGQRQRIGIAMAIAMRPDLLIADEPTSALDVTIQAQILALLADLKRETGMGLVLISHDMSIVGRVADRVAVMKDGEIVETGPVAKIFAEPKHTYTRRLLDAIPGRHPLRASDAAAPRERLLEVSHLARHYTFINTLFRRDTGQVVRAVDDVSFHVDAGETLGIVGESGSGKSTVARLLLRLDQPTGGTVRYRGEDVFAFSEEKLARFRRKVQIVFQDPTASLNPRMTVERIISEPWAIHPDVVSRADRHDRVAELLKQVGLKPEHARRHPHQFSGGQRQRIAIARALALDPELIVCDEAVSSLDVSVQAQVIALLKRLQQEQGLTYMFITHDLPVVRDIARRVLVMHRGKIVEQGEAASIFANPQHPYTRELLAASPAAVLHSIEKAG